MKKKQPEKEKESDSKIKEMEKPELTPQQIRMIELTGDKFVGVDRNIEERLAPPAPPAAPGAPAPEEHGGQGFMQMIPQVKRIMSTLDPAGKATFLVQLINSLPEEEATAIKTAIAQSRSGGKASLISKVGSAMKKTGGAPQASQMRRKLV